MFPLLAAIPIVGALASGESKKIISKANLTAATDSDSFASMQSIVKCNVNADLVQQQIVNSIQIGDHNKADYSQTGSLKVLDLKCINKTQVTNEMATTVLNNLKAKASAQSTDFGGIFGSGANANVTENITNNIKNEVNMDSITEQTTKLMMNQLQKINSTQIGNLNEITVSQAMTASMIADTMSESLKSNKTVVDVSNKMAAETMAEQNISFAEILKAGGLLALAPFLILAIVILAIVIGGAVVFSKVILPMFVGSNTTISSGNKSFNISNKKHKNKSHKPVQNATSVPTPVQNATSVPTPVQNATSVSTPV